MSMSHSTLIASEKSQRDMEGGRKLEGDLASVLARGGRVIFLSSSFAPTDGTTQASVSRGPVLIFSCSKEKSGKIRQNRSPGGRPRASHGPLMTQSGRSIEQRHKLFKMADDALMPIAILM